jgi:hypothetical protein
MGANKEIAMIEEDIRKRAFSIQRKSPTFGSHRWSMQ